MFVRTGRLNMYRPDGALIVHPRCICIRASIPAGRSEDATACRALRHSEHNRPAAIYAPGTDGVSSDDIVRLSPRELFASYDLHRMA